MSLCPSLRLTGAWWSRKPAAAPLTIVTQLSLDRVEQLFAQCKSWPGPISAVMYVAIQRKKEGEGLDDGDDGEYGDVDSFLQGAVAASADADGEGHVGADGGAGGAATAGAASGQQQQWSQQRRRLMAQRAAASASDDTDTTHGRQFPHLVHLLQKVLDHHGSAGLEKGGRGGPKQHGDRANGNAGSAQKENARGGRNGAKEEEVGGGLPKRGGVADGIKARGSARKVQKPTAAAGGGSRPEGSEGQSTDQGMNRHRDVSGQSRRRGRRLLQQQDGAGAGAGGRRKGRVLQQVEEGLVGGLIEADLPQHDNPDDLLRVSLSEVKGDTE